MCVCHEPWVVINSGIRRRQHQRNVSEVVERKSGRSRDEFIKIKFGVVLNEQGVTFSLVTDVD